MNRSVIVAIIYVKKDATGDGTSWNSAFGSLTDAIASASAGDEIWVAAGTYKPTDGTDRNASFVLQNHVKVYGGFTGVETSLDQRDFENNVTILSGEIGDSETINDNSYHVLTADYTTNTTVLDGFTITGGNSNNTGGGMYIIDGSPLLNNLIFDNNNASSGGGVTQC